MFTIERTKKESKQPVFSYEDQLLKIRELGIVSFTKTEVAGTFVVIATYKDETTKQGSQRAFANIVYLLTEEVNNFEEQLDEPYQVELVQAIYACRDKHSNPIMTFKEFNDLLINTMEVKDAETYNEHFLRFNELELIDLIPNKESMVERFLKKEVV